MNRSIFHIQWLAFTGLRSVATWQYMEDRESSRLLIGPCSDGAGRAKMKSTVLPMYTLERACFLFK